MDSLVLNPPASAVRHLRQKASRCQPKRWTHDRGSELKVPTNRPLYTAPFHPPCRRDLTGKRSAVTCTWLNPASSSLNSPMLNLRMTGASSCSSPTFISFDSAFSQDMRL